MSIIGMVALGQTFVILTGGIDLSIPWTLNSVAVLLTLFTQGHDDALIWAIPLVLGLALVIGLINGIGVAVLNISPVIMTLGMNAILQGILLGYTSGGRPGSVAPERGRTPGAQLTLTPTSPHRQGNARLHEYRDPATTKGHPHCDKPSR